MHSWSARWSSCKHSCIKLSHWIARETRGDRSGGRGLGGVLELELELLGMALGALGTELPLPPPSRAAQDQDHEQDQDQQGPGLNLPSPSLVQNGPLGVSPAASAWGGQASPLVQAQAR